MSQFKYYKLQEFQEIATNKDGGLIYLNEFIDNNPDAEYILMWLINYSLLDKNFLDRVVLSEEILQNMRIMSELYKCGNYKFNYKYAPISDNNQHIVKYIRELYNSTDDKLKEFILHKVLVFHFQDKINDTNFLSLLLQEFNNENLIDTLNEIYNQKFKQNSNAEFNQLINDLSYEAINRQAQIGGKEFLKRINPNKITSDMIIFGIKKDDFDSLSLLPNTKIKSNKSLIIQAMKYANEHNKSDLALLRTFLFNNLNPIKSLPAKNTNEPSKKEFDNTNFEILLDIAQDSNFWNELDIGTIHRRLLKADINLIINEAAKHKININQPNM